MLQCGVTRSQLCELSDLSFFTKRPFEGPQWVNNEQSSQHQRQQNLLSSSSLGKGVLGTLKILFILLPPHFLLPFFCSGISFFLACKKGCCEVQGSLRLGAQDPRWGLSILWMAATSQKSSGVFARVQ